MRSFLVTYVTFSPICKKKHNVMGSSELAEVATYLYFISHFVSGIRLSGPFSNNKGFQLSLNHNQNIS